MRLSARPFDRGFGAYMAYRTQGLKIRVFLDGDQLRLDEVVTVDAGLQIVELFKRSLSGERLRKPDGKGWQTETRSGKVVLRIHPK